MHLSLERRPAEVAHEEQRTIGSIYRLAGR